MNGAPAQNDKPTTRATTEILNYVQNDEPKQGQKQIPTLRCGMTNKWQVRRCVPALVESWVT
jgi:hypothetical protein